MPAASKSRQELADRRERAVRFLLDSCAANRGRGSSAWRSRAFHPWRRWSRAYPETTGYPVPTLYDYVRRGGPQAAAAQEAIAANVTWLLSLQRPSGAFPGGHAVDAGDDAVYLTSRDYLLRRRRPPADSVFNTAQILQGLVRHHEETGDARTAEAVWRGANYLARACSAAGTFEADAYAGSTSPSYFTYALWPLLLAWQVTGDDAHREAARRGLRAVLQRADPTTGFIAGMGFGGRDVAHTHTVAYTLQGLLGAAHFLADEEPGLRQVAEQALRRLFRLGELRKVLPGALGPGWAPDWSYACVTGDCQLALCYVDVYDRTGDARWLNAAARCFTNAAAAQAGDGAIPGSTPVWGRYMAMRWPNWAAKYFVDLSLVLESRLLAAAELA